MGREAMTEIPAPPVSIVEFLTARLDEDQAVAEAATEGPWKWGHVAPPHKYALVGGNGRLMVVPSRTPDVWPSVHVATFMERFHPAAVLAEVAAKRRIIARALKAEADYNLRNAPWPGPEGLYGWLFRDLAAVYSDHPDYQQEWRS